MLRMLGLFATVALMVSIGTVSIAHAIEPVTPVSEHAAALMGHAQGDGDEVSADLDRAYPHHHAGFHDHSIGVPVALPEAPFALRQSEAPAPAKADALHAFATDALQRPPRA